jgi:hypothetical protein
VGDAGLPVCGPVFLCMKGQRQLPSGKRNIPWGHFIASHYLHGFCALCKGKTELDELNAWRVWSLSIPEVDKVVREVQEGGQ